MPIVREYRCPDCGIKFEKFHASRDEPAPQCPNLERHTQGPSEVEQVPSGFALKTNASRAGDMAFKIAEEDYGLSNVKDRSREGENSIIKPVLKPELQHAAANFFAQGPGSPIQGAARSVVRDRGQAMTVARAATAEANAIGANPMQQLHRAFKKQHSRGVPIRVLARSNG